MALGAGLARDPTPPDPAVPRLARALFGNNFSDWFIFLPLSRVRSIVIDQNGAQNAERFPAWIVLRGGKRFRAGVMVRHQVPPLSFCGENDLETISCLPAVKVKSVEFK